MAYLQPSCIKLIALWNLSWQRLYQTLRESAIQKILQYGLLWMLHQLVKYMGEHEWDVINGKEVLPGSVHAYYRWRSQPYVKHHQPTPKLICRSVFSFIQPSYSITSVAASCKITPECKVSWVFCVIQQNIVVELQNMCFIHSKSYTLSRCQFYFF